MNKLTLGQKIAARRKLICLSQEALAEQLEVSRQAVSKWESDITIPEIDKLIALSKLFQVNIGWLLGTESEPATPTGFTDDQLKTIEELLGRYQRPRRSILLKLLAGFAAIATIVLIFVYCNRQMVILSSNNNDLQLRIDGLTADNKLLQEQLDNVHQMLNSQAENNRLITDFFRLEGYADSSLQNVTTTLYMRPKAYLPDSSAFLSIQNPITGYSSSIICNWSEANQLYIARYTIPAADGYKISFILYGPNGVQEENLVDRDAGLSYMGTYCTFHTDPAFPGLKGPISIYIDGSHPSADYVYTVPIYTPHIFAKTAVAYKDIRIILELNGKIIWEQSFLDEFYIAAGGKFLNAADTPIEPNISVPIPMAKVGDELKLYLIAETVNGGAPTQSYYTLLETAKICDSKDLPSNN